MEKLDWIQKNENILIETSKKIWGYAELGRHEYKSSACLQELKFQKKDLYLYRDLCYTTSVPTSQFPKCDNMLWKNGNYGFKLPQQGRITYE